jgi:hypothetical protein
MKKCPYCGREYPDDAKVCAVDQTALVPAVAAPRVEKPKIDPGFKPEDFSVARGPSTNTDEATELRARAENLQLWACICLFGGLICGFGFLMKVMTAEAAAPVPWLWISLGSSLISTSVVLFFFAQLVHIRALLAKK